MRLAVNIPMPALVKLPMEDIIKAHHPADDKWPGLIIDVPEEQIVTDLALATEQCKKLEPLNVRIAIDNFGRAYSAMAKVEELPFEELKLDRTFVADCGTDKVNAPLCKTVIDLAHNFGRSVVAVGIEKAADALALVSMGCDYGQGYPARPADAGRALYFTPAPARGNARAQPRRSRPQNREAARLIAAQCRMSSVGPGVAALEGKIIGVGHRAPFLGRRSRNVIGNAVALAISDRLFLAVKSQTQLLAHIARRGPAHQRLDLNAEPQVRSRAPRLSYWQSPTAWRSWMACKCVLSWRETP